MFYSNNITGIHHQATIDIITFFSPYTCLRVTFGSPAALTYLTYRCVRTLCDSCVHVSYLKRAIFSEVWELERFETSRVTYNEGHSRSLILCLIMLQLDTVLLLCCTVSTTSVLMTVCDLEKSFNNQHPYDIIVVTYLLLHSRVKSSADIC